MGREWVGTENRRNNGMKLDCVCSYTSVAIWIEIWYVYASGMGKGCLVVVLGVRMRIGRWVVGKQGRGCLD